MKKYLDTQIADMMRRTIESGTPNGSPLNVRLRSIPHMMLNIKSIAYEVGRLKSYVEGRKEAPPRPGHYGLTSKICTAADLESSWAAFWMDKFKLPFVYHRKTWELCYVMQCLFESMETFDGKKGLGFACGMERIPSCLASLNAIVTASDAPPDLPSVEQWAKTSQHSSSSDQLFYPDLVSREKYESQVNFSFVDMNRIPAQYEGKFDFCWSICAAEHLGSIEHTIAFMENSLRTLVPGGVAVHTIEYNLDDGETIDRWPTVLLQKRHVEELTGRIAKAGGVLSAPDYSEGNSFQDRYVDTPPYYEIPNEIHLKVDIDGFRCTCLGLMMRKLRA